MTGAGLAVGANPYLNLAEIRIGCVDHAIVIGIQPRQLGKSRLPLRVTILGGGAAADDRKPVVQRAGGIGFYQRNRSCGKMRWGGGYRKGSCLSAIADSPTNYNQVKENDCTPAPLSLE